MAKICLSLTGKTLAQDLETLEKYRKYIDLVELRVDCLDPDESLHIRRFPEMAGVPVILAIRRSIDGGQFYSGEGARITLLAKGLAYAEKDRRRNFAFVDLEEDLNVPGLEEAARTFGTRIIRSWHNTEGVDEDLAGRISKLRRIGDELVKISMVPRSLQDVTTILRIAKATKNIEKIIHAEGEYGPCIGMLSESFFSRMNYITDTGQIDLKELVELYRVREITRNTKIFTVIGFPNNFSGNVRFFNTVFRMENTDAALVPVPVDYIQSFMCLAEEIGIAGILVTPPFKEAMVKYLVQKTREVISIGTCNVAAANPQGWAGYNTDALSFSESIIEALGKKDLWFKKLTIVGAGDIARAVAAEVHRLKGKALILNRNTAQARLLAEPYNFIWTAPGSQRADLLRKYFGIIILTGFPVTEIDSDDDPLEFYRFSGRELVMDLTDKPGKSRCLKRAEEAGCRIVNGFDMLHRQARHQYTYFMNKEFPPSLIPRVGFMEPHDGYSGN